MARATRESTTLRARSARRAKTHEVVELYLGKEHWSLPLTR